MTLATRISETGALGPACVIARSELDKPAGSGGTTFFKGTDVSDVNVDCEDAASAIDDGWLVRLIPGRANEG